MKNAIEAITGHNVTGAATLIPESYFMACNRLNGSLMVVLLKGTGQKTGQAR